MKSVFSFVAVLLLLLPGRTTSANDQPPMPDTAHLAEALAQIDLSLSDVQFEQDEVATWGGDPWRLTLFDLFHRHPFKLPLHSALIRESLILSADNPAALLARAGRYIDQPIRRGLIGDPLDKYLNIPDSLPKPSVTRNKNFLNGAQYDQLKDAIDLVYELAEDDDFFLKQALDDVNKEGLREKLFEFFVGEKEEHNDVVYEVLEKIDLGRLVAGSQDFAEAINRLASLPDTLPFPPVKLEMETRRGLIVIGTKGDDRFEYFTPPFLIVDGGGNDEYVFAGYPERYPFSAIVDFGGDDRYLSSDSTKPGIGGAIIGCTILIDKSGDDLYDGVNVCQGGAIFGAAIVIDRAGNDQYRSIGMSQGAATFGLGVLSDVAGDDSLYCISGSQGFGYTQGCGLLVNADGHDRYVAEDDSLINASSQTPEHNTSLAQGAGFGKRADYLDCHSWAGGVGILCDGAGDDIYSAGLFAQGVGYWYAVGMLIDGSGNDVYDGVWYVQGSSAHFAVGYLDDFGGNDKYTATHNMAVGAGHDFSIGFLIDRGGDDRYTVPNLSLGGGNANGIGIFWELAGDDTYTIDGNTTLGMANPTDGSIRQYLLALGVFVDEAGNDTYSKDRANGTKWVNRLEDEYSGAIGVGIDVVETDDVTPGEVPGLPESSDGGE